MIKVLFQGAFDIINCGHIRAFEDAKKQGDYFIVALNTDNLLCQYKKKMKPVIPFWQRKKVLESIKWIDKVIPADEFSPFKLLKKYKIDVYVIAKEWEESKVEEIKYIKSKGGKIFFTPQYYEGIHSSAIRKKCAEYHEKTTINKNK